MASHRALGHLTTVRVVDFAVRTSMTCSNLTESDIFRISNVKVAFCAVEGAVPRVQDPLKQRRQRFVGIWNISTRETFTLGKPNVLPE